MPKNKIVGGASSPRSSGAALATEHGTALPASYMDADVEAMAADAGGIGIHNPDEWGSNARDDMRFELEHGADVADHLIGHEMWLAIKDAARAFDSAAATAAAAGTAATNALSTHRRNALDRVAFVKKMKDGGRDAPTLSTFFILVAILGASGGGELVLNAISFSVFGLSDKPFVSVLPVFNELTAAGIAITLAIIGIAHIFGFVVRTIEAERDERRYKYVLLGVLAGGEAAAIYGLSIVRDAYLAETNAPAISGGFILVQVGVAAFTAALSWHYAHPYLWVWLQVHRADRTSDQQALEKERIYRAHVATANRFVTELHTLLPQAFHHSGATRATAKRQWFLYVRRIFLSTAEPTTTEFFAKELSQANEARVSGLGRNKTFFEAESTLPTRAPLTTTDLDAAIKKVRQEIERVEDAIRGLDTAAQSEREAPSSSAEELSEPTDEELDELARQAVASVGDQR